jgi:dimethylargininase
MTNDSTRFRHALVRPPGARFAAGLTTSDLGAPDFVKAREQHARYCEALQRCGLTLKRLTLTRLSPGAAYPDSTFVEDCAVLVSGLAILTRPGAPSRRGEVPAIRKALGEFFPESAEIAPPGTLDGGDVCEAGSMVFVGVGGRTNEKGAQQLARLLAQRMYSVTVVDIRGMARMLHLKSGLAYLGDGRLVAAGALAESDVFSGYEVIRAEPGEEFAANCVRVNDHVLIAAGFPKLEATLRRLGYPVIALDVSEFRKMDGGLSCLSLRF